MKGWMKVSRWEAKEFQTYNENAGDPVVYGVDIHGQWWIRDLDTQDLLTLQKRQMFYNDALEQLEKHDFITIMTWVYGKEKVWGLRLPSGTGHCVGELLIGYWSK